MLQTILFGGVNPALWVKMSDDALVIPATSTAAGQNLASSFDVPARSVPMF
jgi:hypothetical protein